MPKPTVTCKLIKVTKDTDSEAVVREVLGENYPGSSQRRLPKNRNLDVITINGLEADEKPKYEVDFSDPNYKPRLPKDKALQLLPENVVNTLFPHHCQTPEKNNIIPDSTLCDQCQHSLDYDTATVPCWYKTLDITGLLFKQAIVRLETELGEYTEGGGANGNPPILPSSSKLYISKFLQMLDTTFEPKNIDAKL